MCEETLFDRFVGVHVSRHGQASHIGDDLVHGLHDCLFVCAAIPRPHSQLCNRICQVGNLLAVVWYADVEARNIIRVFEFIGKFDDCCWRSVPVDADGCLEELASQCPEISEV